MIPVVAPTEEGIARALEVLRGGGVVAHATETCYGLACDLANANAVAKVFAIKHRPTNQAVSALFSSIEEAKRYLVIDVLTQKLVDQYFPGALTVVVPVRTITPLPIWVTADGKQPQTAGIRISSSPIAMQLVQAFGHPLSTTSANVHGKSNPYSVVDMLEQFAGQAVVPDLVIDSGALPMTPPSTVVEVVEGTIRTLRGGAIVVGE